MADEVLRIELEKPDATYAPCEKIRGAVVVRPPSDGRCDGLSVRLGWRTGSRGTPAAGELPPRVLFRGNWAAGRTERYPFEIGAPWDPPTFRGRLFQIEWSLRAAADVPWSADPSVEVPVRLVPSPAAGPPRPLVATVAGSRMPAHVQSVWPLVVVTVVGVGGLVVVGLVPFLTEDERWRTLATGAVVAAWILAIPWYLHLRKHERALGEPEFSISPATVRAGGTIRLRIVIRARAPVAVPWVKADLQVAEVVLSQRQKSTWTSVEVLAAEEADLSGPVSFRAGEATVFETDLRVPGDAPPTFRVQNHRVEGTVGAVIRLGVLREWRQRAEFQIVP